MISERVERLAAELHGIYQVEAKRQGDVRHHDNYDQLPDHIKEFDRVLARFILTREDTLLARLEQVERERDEVIGQRKALEGTLAQRRSDLDKAEAREGNLREYIEKRVEMCEQAIQIEVLAGNTVKESQERHALAELHGILQALKDQAVAGGDAPC